jgi:predicted histidine transporter YuiF (NhaC family)
MALELVKSLVVAAVVAGLVSLLAITDTRRTLCNGVVKFAIRVEARHMRLA